MPSKIKTTPSSEMNIVKFRFSSVKIKLFALLFFAVSIIPNLLFAQFSQQGPKFVGSGAVGNPDLGTSVQISSDGNTAIVGGPTDNSNIGAAWIFIRTGGVWTQQGSKLVGTGAVGSSQQGYSVAISSDGNTTIIGGYGDNTGTGSIWVFTRSGSVWTQQGSKLVGTGGSGISWQGLSVAVSSDGNTIIEGGYHDNSNIGAVWIFTRTGSVWSQQGSKLVGSGGTGTTGQGSSVAISSDGNTAVVGGQLDNNFAGAMWVFIRTGAVWTQQSPKLVGSGVVGIARQGASVAISADGNTFISGGPDDNSVTGAVWVFTRSGNVWTQQGSKIIGIGAIGNARQGASVAISADGNTAVFGGYYDNNNAGAIWVFTRNGVNWTQLSKLVGTGPNGTAVLQGTSVAISSEGTVIEGGLGDVPSGAAWIFNDPTIGITPISSEIPKSFSLSQNYPNPFNPSSKIKFDITKSSLTFIKVYNILGQEITTLVNEQLQPGTYEINFDGTNLPSGVYFYKLIAGDYVETKKMLMIK